jgi:hypothetical protein
VKITTLWCAPCAMIRMDVKGDRVKRAKYVIDGYAVCGAHIGAVHSLRAQQVFDTARTIDENDRRNKS